VFDVPKIVFARSHLRKHELVHQNLEFSCSKCTQTFKSPEHLEQHLVRIHSGIKPYKCSHCELRFAIQKRRILHENRMHCRNRSRMLKCPECSNYYTKPGTFKIHMSRSHTNYKFECPVSGFQAKFRFKKGLKQHTKCGRHHNQKEGPGRNNLLGTQKDPTIEVECSGRKYDVGVVTCNPVPKPQPSALSIKRIYPGLNTTVHKTNENFEKTEKRLGALTRQDLLSRLLNHKSSQQKIIRKSHCSDTI